MPSSILNVVHVRKANSARWKWLLVTRHVLRILRARRAWAKLGQTLNRVSGLTDHLERIASVLRHKDKTARENFNRALKEQLAKFTR